MVAIKESIINNGNRTVYGIAQILAVNLTTTWFVFDVNTFIQTKKIK